MSYRLLPGEPVELGLKRVALEQLDRVARELTDPEFDDHRRVHELRKRFKKVRAAVRLVRPALGAAYSPTNAWFRDRARRFSDLRDAQALVETVVAAREALPLHVAAPLSRLERELLARRDRLAAEADLEGLLGELREELDLARELVEGWSLEASGYEALAGGLRKTYLRARARRREACASPTAEVLHALRKRLKYHRHHVRLLRDLWPPVIDAYHAEAHELTDLLGDLHDLHVLRRTLIAERPAERLELEELGELLDARGQDLLARAWPLASRLLCEEPDALVARFAGTWRAWRRTTAAALVPAASSH